MAHPDASSPMEVLPELSSGDMRRNQNPLSGNFLCFCNEGGGFLSLVQATAQICAVSLEIVAFFFGECDAKQLGSTAAGFVCFGVLSWPTGDLLIRQIRSVGYRWLMCAALRPRKTLGSDDSSNPQPKLEELAQNHWIFNLTLKTIIEELIR